MQKRILLLISAILFSNALFAQFDFKTVAEESDYKSTSRYEDVIKFIDQLKIHPHTLKLKILPQPLKAEKFRCLLLLIHCPILQLIW